MDCPSTSPKHVSYSGLNSDEGSSGSTQWHNAARARMWLRGVKDDETSELRELVIEHSKRHPIVGINECHRRPVAYGESLVA
jgi:hypothetical protein